VEVAFALIIVVALAVASLNLQFIGLRRVESGDIKPHIHHLPVRGSNVATW
jgi:hypothetical protein